MTERKKDKGTTNDLQNIHINMKTRQDKYFIKLQSLKCAKGRKHRSTGKLTNNIYTTYNNPVDLSHFSLLIDR